MNRWNQYAESGNAGSVQWQVPRMLRAAGLTAVSLALTACATTGPYANTQPHPRDPLESFNRGVYGFNDAVDKAVYKPVANAYKAVVPQFARTGLNNFVSNLRDAWSAVNSGLQFKPQATAENAMRFAVNTTFGLAGLIDIASDIGLERHTEDFGQTLGHWGVGAGPYVVLPFYGPSTLRDLAALPVDFQGELVNQIEPVATRNALLILTLTEARASLLSASDMIDEAALDPYLFTRDAFLQLRQSRVYDGYPPDEEAPEQKQPAK